MKILLVNHGTADNWSGGDSVQIAETAKRLKWRGHQVHVQNSDKPDVSGVDLVHIFNSRVQHSLPGQIASCTTARKPIVISPIWINLGKALWGSRGALPVLLKATKEGEDAAASEMELLINRKLVVVMPEGELKALGDGDFQSEWHQEIPKLIAQADGLLPNSWLELKAVQNDLHWSGSNYKVAHYGVDPKLFLDADPEPFRQFSGIKEPFVMQAGRIEPGKNQAMLCWALRKTNVPIVLIGGTSNWPGYAELCKEISGNRVTIINHLPQELLASAYAAARVHCLVSWMDTCGLVSLEAALNSTPVVGSTFGHELEYLRDDAWLADPANPETIFRAVLDAWEAGRHSKRAISLKQRVLKEFTWENTVNETEAIYRQVLNGTS